MRQLLFVTIAALSLAVAACGEGEPNPRTEDILALTGDVAAGEPIYQANCASCHAADMTGGTGPNLIEEVSEHSDEDILNTILNGEGPMPAFDETLSDQEAADLMAWMRDTAGG